MTRICFVCLGNICRSPLADAVLRHQAQEANLGHRVEVCSRGVGDWHLGSPADARMRATARRHGVTVDGVSELIQRDDFHTCDVVFAMDRARLADLKRLAPAGTEHKVLSFRAFDPQGGPNDDVPDPYYGGDEGFETVFTIVTRTCEAILEQIRHGAPFIEE